MGLFTKSKTVPTSYKPVLEGSEVVELFARLTLYQQAALLRLISRNIMIKIRGEEFMGFEFEFDVNGAVIDVSASTVEESES